MKEWHWVIRYLFYKGVIIGVEVLEFILLIILIRYGGVIR